MNYITGKQYVTCCFSRGILGGPVAVGIQYNYRQYGQLCKQGLVILGNNLIGNEGMCFRKFEDWPAQKIV